MTNSTKPNPNAIALCMIVRNEVETLEACLNSVQALCTEMIVVDTGSWDRSPALARSLGAKVYSFDWCDDFAAARNFALAQLSQVQHAQSPWILLLDADEALTPAALSALQDWQSLSHDPETCWQLPIWNLDDHGQCLSVHRNFRLFPHHPQLRFQGRFHEYLAWTDRRPAQVGFLPDVVIQHRGFAASFRQKKNKTERDLSYLRKLVSEHPQSLRWRIHLADTLFQAQNKAQAQDEALSQYRAAETLLQAPPNEGIELPGLISPASEKAKARCHVQLRILESLYLQNQPHLQSELQTRLNQIAPDCQAWPEYWYLAGRIWRQLKDWNRAEAAFRHCLSFQNQTQALSHYQPAQVHDLPWLQLLHLYRFQRCRPNSRTSDLTLKLRQAVLALLQTHPEGQYPHREDNLYLFWLETWPLPAELTQADAALPPTARQSQTWQNCRALLQKQPLPPAANALQDYRQNALKAYLELLQTQSLQALEVLSRQAQNSPWQSAAQALLQQGRLYLFGLP